MSMGYCGIATVLSAMHKPGPEVSYTPGQGLSNMAYIMAVFNAVTTMLFAYGGHNIALEIQATLPSPPSTVKPMIRGVNIAFVVTGACYLLVSVTGFHAFGVGVSDDVLENFTQYPTPVAIANFMVVIHVGAAYQVYTHPVFDMIEVQMRKKTAGGAPVHPLLRAAYRIVYVALITLVAILIPFFGSLMGLVGALGITPTTFLLPCLLWVLYKQPRGLAGAGASTGV